MVFSSLLFLFRFLPAVLLLYFAVPRRMRNAVLLVFSLVFYAWGEPVYVLLMLCSILITYLGGRFVSYFQEKDNSRAARIAMWASIICALALLGFFKYTDFVIRTVNQVTGGEISLLRLGLPIGISFYTFQSISYVVDVYRHTANVQRNILSYGAYVTMFPQLIAGPIVQYKTIDRQLRSRRESAEEFAEGVNRFTIGLGKKVLLANNAGRLWDYIRVMPAGELPAVMAWMGIIAFTFQIYFDFSGYSDMAIGLGHMFGFRFLENFNYPYLSSSITEFWRRWHISLGTWFREYVYIPLGGNRRGTAVLIRNTLIVWLLTGIWHGADWNFFIWGLYYGILLLIEKLFLSRVLDKLPCFVRRIYCMFFVIMGWYIFSFGDISAGTGYLAALVGAAGNTFAGGESLYLILNYALLLLVLCIGSSDLPARAGRRILSAAAGSDTACAIIRCLFILAVFLLSIAYLVDASYNPFLYFRF